MATTALGFNPSRRHEAASLAARLPNLVIAARKVALSVMHGVHGRRRAGPGETFWQFRPFVSGEPAVRVDWRRSAREDRAFVREREWEAAHTVWMWFDRSPTMRFGSKLGAATKIDRAAVLTLAAAELVVRGGERAGFLGLTRPLASRAVLDRFAEALISDEAQGSGLSPLPPDPPTRASGHAVLVSDFLSPAEELEPRLRRLAEGSATAEIIVIADPIEETFPFTGHVEFRGLGEVSTFRVPRAEDLRADYVMRLRNHRDFLRSLCRSLGWGFAVHRTDESPAAALLALRARLEASAGVDRFGRR